MLGYFYMVEMITEEETSDDPDAQYPWTAAAFGSDHDNREEAEADFNANVEKALSGGFDKPIQRITLCQFEIDRLELHFGPDGPYQIPWLSNGVLLHSWTPPWIKGPIRTDTYLTS